MRLVSASPPILLAALVGAAAAGGAAARTPVEGAPLPGWWRYETSFFSGDKVEEKCVGPDQIAKVLDGPSNSHYACTYPVRRVGGGRARFEGTCTEKKHGTTVPARFSGVYGPEHFALTGEVQVRLGVLPLPVSASITATRLSPTCPAA